MSVVGGLVHPGSPASRFPRLLLAPPSAVDVPPAATSGARTTSASIDWPAHPATLALQPVADSRWSTDGLRLGLASQGLQEASRQVAPVTTAARRPASY